MADTYKIRYNITVDLKLCGRENNTSNKGSTKIWFILRYFDYKKVLQSFEIRPYGPLCDVSEIGIYLGAESFSLVLVVSLHV